MHPDMKPVIPIAVEPIKNTDGTKKQDCEINAAKRLIPRLRQQHPKMGLLITGDDLFSRQSLINLVRNMGFEYCFVVKKAAIPS